MDNKRRQFLKSGIAVGGLGAFAAGYATTTKHMSKVRLKHRRRKNA
ncbi:tetrathionate reductase subunit A [Vibrio sp. JCM 18905]|nr:tetrathionate reductase subunit A [Vibrio sp. JCM 18905]